MNLTERLDKHLQSIKEANNKITPKELYDIIKSHKNELLKLTNRSKNLYQNQDFIVNDPLENGPSLDMFGDSYVGGAEFDFIAYCICNYLGIDSGININDAYKDIEKLVINGKGEYHDREDGFWGRGSLQKYLEEEPGAWFIKDATDYCKKNKISPKELVFAADDSGDEFLNPIDFAADSSEFAKLCKANQLANKLQSLSNKAKWLSDRIYIL